MRVRVVRVRLRAPPTALQLPSHCYNHPLISTPISTHRTSAALSSAALLSSAARANAPAASAFADDSAARDCRTLKRQI